MLRRTAIFAFWTFVLIGGFYLLIVYEDRMEPAFPSPEAAVRQLATGPSPLARNVADP